MIYEFWLIIASSAITYLSIFILHQLKLTQEYKDIEKLKSKVDSDFQKLRMDMEIFKQNIQTKVNELFTLN